MNTSAFLSVANVSYQTPRGQVLLQNVSFELRQGDILAIAGPNGAGKSTLLELLCGALPLSSGAVRFGGRSLSTMTAMERARLIAVVGQQDLPDTRLTLREYVALGQIPILADRSAKDHAKVITEILDMTDLTSLASSTIGQLSGGERQRAHIARALAQNPSVLFLDEPTNHLDVDAKGRMLSLVAQLGITVIMILHDLVLIPEFATHLALIKHGQLTGFGPVDSVLTPERVHTTFGVDYLSFAHQGRVISALDIRKTPYPDTIRNNQV